MKSCTHSQSHSCRCVKRNYCRQNKACLNLLYRRKQHIVTDENSLLRKVRRQNFCFRTNSFVSGFCIIRLFLPRECMLSYRVFVFFIVQVKIWKIPPSGVEVSLNPVSSFTGFKKRPELVQHHPVAERILSVAAGSSVQMWDLASECCARGLYICDNERNATIFLGQFEKRIYKV